MNVIKHAVRVCARVHAHASIRVYGWMLVISFFFLIR